MKISIEKLLQKSVILSLKNEDVTTFSESDILNQHKNDTKNKSKNVVKSTGKRDYTVYFAQSTFQMAPEASELPMPDQLFFS